MTAAHIFSVVAVVFAFDGKIEQSLKKKMIFANSQNEALVNVWTGFLVDISIQSHTYLLCLLFFTLKKKKNCQHNFAHMYWYLIVPLPSWKLNLCKNVVTNIIVFWWSNSFMRQNLDALASHLIRGRIYFPPGSPVPTGNFFIVIIKFILYTFSCFQYKNFKSRNYIFCE